MPESKLRPTSEFQSQNLGGLVKTEGLGSENFWIGTAINVRAKFQLPERSNSDSLMDVNDLSRSETEKSNSYGEENKRIPTQESDVALVPPKSTFQMPDSFQPRRAST